MILRLAIRSLAARPVRSLVLAIGFGLGVGVMATLLGVGGVILEQAKAPDLIGGGDALIGTMIGRVPNAPFVLYTLRPGGPFGFDVRTLAPSIRESLYLRHDGHVLAVRVKGSLPSADRALADPETAAAAWEDTPADREWAAPDAHRVLRSIDRFHAIPDVPARARSWAEWLYFNGNANGARFYLTVLAGPEVKPGQRGLGVRLQLERSGRVSAYSSGAIADAAALVAQAPDVTAGPNSVRLEGTDYRITLDLPAESGRGRVTGTIVVHADPDRSVPPFVLEGAGGWISGYTVPVMAGALDGELQVDGTRLDLRGGSAYHDHNWGFWRGVSWQWGQVHDGDLSFVYGRVYPPADAADARRLPGFLAVLGPSGPLAFSTRATIEETNAAGSDRPSRIAVRVADEGLTADLDLAVEQTTVTHMRPGGVGDGLDFLQLRARYRVHARVGDRQIDFEAPGSAETFRGR